LKWGMWLGSLHGGLHMWVNDLRLGALVAWTLRHPKPHNGPLRPAAQARPAKPDSASLVPASQAPRIEYPKYDGVITFDKLSSVFLSNTNHAEAQPVPLQLRYT